VRYLNETLDKAANRAVQDLVKDGGIGGVIALDNHGNGEFVPEGSLQLMKLHFKSVHALELSRHVSWSY
jgi:isoaspartyl peptidase/L-asparaginase-like protein (Ntn-hydrolase superfamily)